MRRIVTIIFLCFFFVSGCFSTSQVNGTVLYPIHKLANDAEYISPKNLPKSACFQEKSECFNLSYASSNKDDVMYLLLEKDGVLRVYKFFTKTIDNMFVMDGKLFIVFVDQTELYGWIKYENGEYIFRMFSDPEL